jgi:MoxR-like ATPase
LDRAADEVDLKAVTGPAGDRDAALARADRVSPTCSVRSRYRRDRSSQQVQVGASPRGALFANPACPRPSVLHGRYVIPDDIKAVGVRRSRTGSLRPELWVRKVSPEDVIARITPTFPCAHQPGRLLALIALLWP